MKEPIKMRVEFSLLNKTLSIIEMWSKINSKLKEEQPKQF